jgi:HNH endonuclease
VIDIERSQPAPESLAEGKGWRGEDVKARLREDFLRKCYLCEGTLGLNFEVEHRHPRSAGGGKHDWHNLFPAHHDCNNGRPAYPPGGLLSPGDGVEQLLRQWLDSDHLPCFAATSSEDMLAHNTAHELDHIHRGSTDAAADLRAAIVKQLAHVLVLANRWLVLQLHGEGDTLEARNLAYELGCQVGRDAPYSLLIRSKLDPRLLQSLR